jgi:hypothetical protein
MSAPLPVRALSRSRPPGTAAPGQRFAAEKARVKHKKTSLFPGNEFAFDIKLCHRVKPPPDTKNVDLFQAFYEN